MFLSLDLFVNVKKHVLNDNVSLMASVLNESLVSMFMLLKSC